METILYQRRKRTGKRSEDISQLEVVVDETITLPEDALNTLFPEGYRRLPDEVYHEVEYIPARLLVHEKHIAVYAGKNDTGIVKANRPERLLKNSLLTPSLAAGVIEAKYVNHIPLNRLSEDFRRKDFEISRQVLVKPLVDSYFEWVKSVAADPLVDKGSKERCRIQCNSVQHRRNCKGEQSENI